jgi:hypothetical protein
MSDDRRGSWAKARAASNMRDLDPPSFAFELIDPNNPLLGGPVRVAPQGHDGRVSGTQASRHRDAKPTPGGPTQISDALKSSPVFMSIAEIATRKAKS